MRRLRDIDRTGCWIVLLPLPPLNLAIYLMACLPGTTKPNRFGPDPRDAKAFAAGTPVDRHGGAVAGTAMPPPAEASRGDLIAELERLGRLRKDGHLSEAEFEVMKAQALAGGRAG